MVLLGIPAIPLHAAHGYENTGSTEALLTSNDIHSAITVFKSPRCGINASHSQKSFNIPYSPSAGNSSVYKNSLNSFFPCLNQILWLEHRLSGSYWDSHCKSSYAQRFCLYEDKCSNNLDLFLKGTHPYKFLNFFWILGSLLRNNKHKVTCKANGFILLQSNWLYLNKKPKTKQQITQNKKQHYIVIIMIKHLVRIYHVYFFFFFWCLKIFLFFFLN